MHVHLPDLSGGVLIYLLVFSRVGAMVIVDGQDKVIGILSERDIVRVVAEQGAPGLAQPVSSWQSNTVKRMNVPCRHIMEWKSGSLTILTR